MEGFMACLRLFRRHTYSERLSMQLVVGQRHYKGLALLR